MKRNVNILKGCNATTVVTQVLKEIYEILLSTKRTLRKIPEKTQ